MLLLRPLQLGSLRLANRVFMAPMTRSRAGAGRVPTQLMAAYYAQRASAGLIISEAAQISLEGVGYPDTPGIHTPEQVAAWRAVTDAVHARGGRIWVQLWHVGRISHPCMQPDHQLPVAPSAIAADGEVFTPWGPKRLVTPRALDTAEVRRVVGDFAAAASCAKAAGFDGAEIHASGGYLIDQFLRDQSNQRSDAYGGSASNRARLLLEVVEAVAGVWGIERTGVRLCPRNMDFFDIVDSDPIGTFSLAIAELSRLRLGLLHVIEYPPDHEFAHRDPGPEMIPRLRGLFSGPIAVNGGFDRERAEAVLRAGMADAVSFGKPFLANPDLPRRFELRAPLNAPDVKTFYGGDARGYTDYPAWEG
jgi:N-ethylmaleimide reductase